MDADIQTLPKIQCLESDNSGDSYSTLSERCKKWTLVVSAMVDFVSAASAGIYLPALGPISRELSSSKSMITLSITLYTVVEGITPLFTAGFSDAKGRRPMIIVCLVLYAGINIGLAIQRSLKALFVLRVFQSVGATGASIVATAVLPDIVPRSERGRYLVYSSLGTAVAPIVGPLLGGILTQLAGWASIFWFSAAYAAVLLVVMIFFQPETCRCIVGNGSVSAPRWNQPLVKLFRLYRKRQQAAPARDTILFLARHPGPRDSLRIILEKESGLLVFCDGILYSGWIALLTSIPILLERNYDYNSLQIALCYIPCGAGCLISRQSMGTLLDRRFRREGHKAGIKVLKNQQTNVALFPLEKARISIVLPFLYLTSVLVVVYGWLMQYRVHVAGPLIVLFFLSNAMNSAISTVSTLVIDFHAERPGAATAAIWSVTSLFAAGAVAAVVPLIEGIGIGWVGCLISLSWVLCSPIIVLVYFRGHGWRSALEREQNSDSSNTNV